MDEACNMKIQRLELSDERHEEQLTKHERAIDEQGKTLHDITTLLSQIRWMVIGGIGFFVVSNIGLLPILKKIIGA